LILSATHLLQNPIEEHATDYGRFLNDPLGFFREAVQAREQHSLQRIGDTKCLNQRAHFPAMLLLGQDAFLDK